MNKPPQGETMSFEEIDRETVQKVVERLDQALYNHQIWFNSLLRTLICKLPPDQHDMNPEAYKECRFGQWYYAEKLKDLMEHPGYKAIGEEHVRLHQLTRSLLNTLHTGATITPPDYDNFSNALDRLRLEIATLKRELENLVYNRDTLTGAINRINMLTLLREQQEISKRENQPCFLAMLDIDFFKKINDQYGHPIGDKVLIALVHLILQNFHRNEKLFRYGGEEFLICLNNVESNGAFEWIEALRKQIAETTLFTEPNPIHITVSFGLAPLNVYAPVEQSIQYCDEALLTAKAAGRNCTKIWEPAK
ncbi:MAG: hypothetical protein A3D96_04900 [Chlamydiae bacterium RIFCSPHIGHO2_12_FULL_44_59]|nr:MAG: hypothetical protein A2796_03435 [Chlamydiae bacterium RIFCSPHIGHO2_01_FULL_44_39]OGN57131.1 MAG: hypothetical protein A3C42_02720 [Chlamydiae bacterium RIFCSPHIGHO2_02_FULL_45_9]OGN60159.1 MAG: hypothetical protein A3D96_04900 [Chlamydiae bacterium RIFCSPHIGHO2_12_FULL_44_59]OGN67188.1 MAG: hypothetical protein A2978_01140 [Chlamydiae bacterium RIFCSPLOWO2_01_FULL_44_52]OGN67778.1 MAG: hypothetical protein A3I67_05075 [Chlamydiae bacterium RIFCSPLOWO2_02_FULL_45_22]OGN71481.1 MAG: hyp